jgi:protein-disulfide isomerase/peroxiredoxin/uncharacterized membrane protein
MSETHGERTPNLGMMMGLSGAVMLLLAGFVAWVGLDVVGADSVDVSQFGADITRNGWMSTVALLLGLLATSILGARQAGKELVAPAMARKLLLAASSLGLLIVFSFLQNLPELSDEQTRQLLGDVEGAYPELEAQAVEAGHRILGFSLALGSGLWLAGLGSLLLLGSQIVSSRQEAALYGALASLFVGINVAIHLVGIKIDLLAGGSGNAGCQVSPGFDCGSVNSSVQSMMFGVPISLLALPTYALMAYLIITAWRGGRSVAGDEQARGNYSLKLATCIALLTVGYSAYLYYVSSVVIGKLCLFCMVLYGVHAVSAVLLVIALKDGILAAVFDVLASLKPVLPALGVFVIVGGISWATYDDMQRTTTGAQQEEALESAKDQQDKLDRNDEVLSSEKEALKKRMLLLQKQKEERAAKAMASKPSTGSTAAAPVQAKKVRAKGPRKCKTFDLGSIVKKEPPPPEKRGDGYRYYETPIDPDCDFIAGNPDALVTVVKYADFQCQYCKMLASAFKPMKEKYKDKVRFVMKQFPMNGKCNPRMGGYDKHPYACESAYASHCAGVQGKFWEMHDALYDRQKDLEPVLIRTLAERVGVDLAQYDTCLSSAETKEFINQDIKLAFNAQIYGTPKTYINNRLVTGSTSSILDYHIKRAIQSVEKLQNELSGGKTKAVVAPVPDGRSMIAAKSADGSFFIDPYESSFDKDGKAVAFKGVEPVQASWFEAKEGCEKAGKRLCTEAEWISACTGMPAEDNNNNGWFSDDDVEGDMYPYGGFYERGYCQDSADKYNGTAVAAGSKSKCRTNSGVFDLTGNIGEWVNSDKNKATLMGGNAGSGERAACNQRSYGKGLGRKNHTTGFRCCADTNVTRGVLAESDLKADDADLMQKKVPSFKVTDQSGKVWTEKTLQGKVTLVNFFASWCGPCKKEFPYLVKYLAESKKKGFQILALGQDGRAETSYEFAKKFNSTFPVAHDADSTLMGLFRVYSMPTTFLVDRKGIVRYMDTGFKPAEQAEKLRQAILGLL